jgi:uncharacterized membrane protein YhaH (DUF805 family)
MLCSCGVNNIFGAKVCKSCGASLEVKPSVSTATPSASNASVNEAVSHSGQHQTQVVAASNVQKEATGKVASSELDFIPYTSNIQFNYFIKGLRHSFDFNGRATKSEFWYFVLFEILTLLVIGIFSTTLYALASLVMVIPATAVMVRRIHDIGRSWKSLLFLLIPVVGLVVLYWLIQPSEVNENAWGPVPSDS